MSAVPTSAEGAPPAPARSGAVVPVLASAGITVALMQTLVIPLVPELPKLLNASASGTAWAITATLLARAATPTSGAGDGAGFLAGLSAGWRAFTTSVTVLLTGLGVLLPWLVAFGVPTAAGVWWTRRRRAPHATPAAVEPPSGPSPA